MSIIGNSSSNHNPAGSLVTVSFGLTNEEFTGIYGHHHHCQLQPANTATTLSLRPKPTQVHVPMSPQWPPANQNPQIWDFYIDTYTCPACENKGQDHMETGQLSIDCSSRMANWIALMPSITEDACLSGCGI